MRDLINLVEAADGQVWYHGTTADFDEFEAQPDSHLGFHFGTREQANRIIGRKPGGRILMARLNFQKALRTIDAGDWSNPYQAWETIYRALTGKRYDPTSDPFFATLTSQGMSRQERLAAIRERVEAAGYDAIIYRNRIEGTGDSVIVFHPGQIRLLGKTG